MAKSKSSSGNTKMSFGKKKSQPTGKKSYNKHSPKPKAYRGQGR
jgi:hypothetical protein